MENIVRPLEWRRLSGHGGGFRYSIGEPSYTKGWRVWVQAESPMMSVGGAIVTTLAATCEAAQAAAQVDYEQRILSALDLTAADALAAENARLKGLVGEAVEGLREAEELIRLTEHPAFPDPIYHAEVKALGSRIGFGALMSTASAGWREWLAEHGHPDGSEYVAGPCFGSVQRTLGIVRALLTRLHEATNGRNDGGESGDNVGRAMAKLTDEQKDNLLGDGDAPTPPEQPAPAEPEAEAAQPLPDEEIVALIHKHFPWQSYPQVMAALTYEKSVPLFPQATYDVPKHATIAFVREIEGRTCAALRQRRAAEAEPVAWRPDREACIAVAKDICEKVGGKDKRQDAALVAGIAAFLCGCVENGALSPLYASPPPTPSVAAIAQHLAGLLHAGHQRPKEEVEDIILQAIARVRGEGTPEAKRLLARAEAAEAESARLRSLLGKIIAADDEFRASMAADTEKDPVTLACDAARLALKEHDHD